jgi:Rab-GTPase-TBC domain
MHAWTTSSPSNESDTKQPVPSPPSNSSRSTPPTHASTSRNGNAGKLFPLYEYPLLEALAIKQRVVLEMQTGVLHSIRHASTPTSPSSLTSNPTPLTINEQGRCYTDSFGRNIVMVKQQAVLFDPPFVGDADPLDFVDLVRTQWDARLRYEIRNAATQCNRPLVRYLGVQPAASRRQDSSSLDALRFVFTSEDFLETLCSIRSPNMRDANTDIGLIKVQLQTPDIRELRIIYTDLQPEICQYGVDDSNMSWFREKSLQTAKELVENGSVPEIRQYARTGIPASMRNKMWASMLNAHPGQAGYDKFIQMQNSIVNYDFITDELMRMEIAHASDNDEFFVFTELLEQIMLTFARDSQVPSACAVPPNSAPITSAGSSLTVPPCSVVPFYQQSLLAAPLCYMYTGAIDAYFVFRQMYCRYWCRLHTISSYPGSALYLAKMFESLVQTCKPTAYHHAVTVGVHPVRIVFPWIFCAFSAYLPVLQVLQLWDRVLAHDSLDLIAVLAAAIFSFRSTAVLEARTKEEIKSVFREISTLQVVPLLQQFLFLE